MVVGGIALMATGVGGPAGTMLLSAGADGLIQKATTGTVNYAEVAVSGLLGGVGGAGLAAKAGLTGAEAVAAGRGLDGALNGVQAAVSYYTGPGPHTASGALFSIGSATAIGALTGGGGGQAASGAAQAAESQLTTVGEHALADVAPTPTLFHYTDEAGMNGILDSHALNPSLKSLNLADARYGDGQYLSDIAPGQDQARRCQRPSFETHTKVSVLRTALKLTSAAGRPDRRTISTAPARN
jgi:hypothetical protein